MFLYREVLPFYIWFYPPMVNHDVCLYDLVKLVVVIPTSPRTSKTEFVFKRYLRFRIDGFPVFHGEEVPLSFAEVPGEVPLLVPLNLLALGCPHFISGTWCGSSG